MGIEFILLAFKDFNDEDKVDAFIAISIVETMKPFSSYYIYLAVKNLTGRIKIYERTDEKWYGEKYFKKRVLYIDEYESEAGGSDESNPGNVNYTGQIFNFYKLCTIDNMNRYSFPKLWLGSSLYTQQTKMHKLNYETITSAKFNNFSKYTYLAAKHLDGKFIIKERKEGSTHEPFTAYYVGLLKLERLEIGYEATESKTPIHLFYKLREWGAGNKYAFKAAKNLTYDQIETMIDQLRVSQKDKDSDSLYKLKFLYDINGKKIYDSIKNSK